MSALAWLRQASTPADRILALVLLLALPLAFWIGHGRPAGHLVQIFQGRHLFAELPLNQNRRIAVSGPIGTTVVEVKDDRAHVLSSPCTGKQCIQAGWLSHAHDSAACLPNRVLVMIPGNPDGQHGKPFDAVAE